MAMDDREQQFERALARLLRDASPESHCPDAETLSAYHERSLPGVEMTHWKEHISQCVRCQEILTLVEQSEEVPAEEWAKQEEPAQVYGEELPALMVAGTQRPLQPTTRAAAAAPMVAPIREMPSRARWRWLIPVGALAACAIVAVGILEIQMQHRKEAEMSVQMAQNQRPGQQAAVPFSVPPAPQSMQQLNQQQHEAQTLDQAMRDQKEASPLASRAVPPSSNAIASSHDTVAPSPKNEPALVPRREALPNATARMAAPAATEASDFAIVDKDHNSEAAKVPAPAPPAAAGALKKSAPEEKAKEEARSSPQAVEVQADSISANVSSAAVPVNSRTTNLLEVAAADHRYIVAPGMKSVWRVGVAGKIERSSDRGKTWKEENSGVTADLTAGSATSDKVCWLIGKSGTILLSTDGGKHWQQVASPIAGDIGGIHATDAQHASIWDVPNRVSYETSDGGATWNRVANE
jgi:hypothetical protein